MKIEVLDELALKWRRRAKKCDHDAYEDSEDGRMHAAINNATRSQLEACASDLERLMELLGG